MKITSDLIFPFIERHKEVKFDDILQNLLLFRADKLNNCFVFTINKLKEHFVILQVIRSRYVCNIYFLFSNEIDNRYLICFSCNYDVIKVLVDLIECFDA
jgi:hypothetical protein